MAISRNQTSLPSQFCKYSRKRLAGAKPACQFRRQTGGPIPARSVQARATANHCVCHAGQKFIGRLKDRRWASSIWPALAFHASRPARPRDVACSRCECHRADFFNRLSGIARFQRQSLPPDAILAKVVVTEVPHGETDSSPDSPRRVTRRARIQSRAAATTPHICGNAGNRELRVVPELVLANHRICAPLHGQGRMRVIKCGSE